MVCTEAQRVTRSGGERRRCVTDLAAGGKTRTGRKDFGIRKTRNKHSPETKGRVKGETLEDDRKKRTITTGQREGDPKRGRIDS